ncbi:hypothetical protein KFL_000140040 [Klebsormidium nitens]|uniref:Uncharacterized protein n=1 Tax=Klebsormidium nitens TaxID=105231 RepID=A0A1Y1HJ06_KLENI|nr:hypothetical protein KFL_000140040 [Klebsormidium nitens]|eukprot:GAQ78485.1 hypothetical protein KFL_000140040 [Klebsormidium nitens]
MENRASPVAPAFNYSDLDRGLPRVSQAPTFPRPPSQHREHSSAGPDPPQAAHTKAKPSSRLEYFCKEVKADARRAEELRRHRKEAERIMLYNRLDYQPSKCHLSNLFHYLWAVNSQGCSCPGVRIPDTLAILNGRAVSWYFTGASGRLLRKNSDKLKRARHILYAMLRGPEKHTMLGSIKAMQIVPDESSEEGLTVSHLDERALRDALMAGSLSDGLLQRFVMPFGDKNVLITCYWYPNFFYMDRSSTFPRPVKPHDKYSGRGKANEELPLPRGEVSLLITQRLLAVCNNIAAHVYKVSPQKYKIAHMRLTFKNDLHGNLWLLYCSELKLEAPPGDPDSAPGKPSGLPALSPEKSASGSSKGAPPAAWVERLYTTSPFRTLRYRKESGLEKLTSGSDESAMLELRALLDGKIKWGARARAGSGAGAASDGGNKNSDGLNRSSDGVNERSDGPDGEDRLPGLFVRNFGALEPLPRIVGLVEGDVARGARASAGGKGLEDYLDGLPSLQSQLKAGGRDDGESGSEDEMGCSEDEFEGVGEGEERVERSAAEEAGERDACEGGSERTWEGGENREIDESRRLPKVGVRDRPAGTSGESDCDAEVARVMGRGRHRGEDRKTQPSKERDSAQGLQPSTSMSNVSSRGGSRGVKRDVIEDRWKPQGKLEKEIQHAFESVAIERKPGALHWGYENEQKPETFARRSKSPVNSGAAYKDDSLLKAFKESGISGGGRSRLSVARRARSREAVSRLGSESDRVA